jgi:hypothetical protein
MTLLGTAFLTYPSCKVFAMTADIVRYSLHVGKAQIPNHTPRPDATQLDCLVEFSCAGLSSGSVT